MTLCETCINYLGGSGVQRGQSLCRTRSKQRYIYPEALGATEGYAPVNKRCHQTEPPKLTGKVRRRVNA